MSRQRAPRHERVLVTAICTYEVVALWTPLPTLTRIVHLHPWLKDAFDEVLDQHFTPPSSPARRQVRRHR